MNKDVAIYKAYELGVKNIKDVTEYTDYIEVIAEFTEIEITYLFYKDGRIVIK